MEDTWDICVDNLLIWELDSSEVNEDVPIYIEYKHLYWATTYIYIYICIINLEM